MNIYQPRGHIKREMKFDSKYQKPILTARSNHTHREQYPSHPPPFVKRIQCPSTPYDYRIAQDVLFAIDERYLK
jgi:hypothetical protein